MEQANTGKVGFIQAVLPVVGLDTPVHLMPLIRAGWCLWSFLGLAVSGGGYH